MPVIRHLGDDRVTTEAILVTCPGSANTYSRDKTKGIVLDSKAWSDIKATMSRGSAGVRPSGFRVTNANRDDVVSL